MPTVAPYDFDEFVQHAGFVYDEPVIALVDGTVVFPVQGITHHVHGGLLSAEISQDKKSLLTGGEDGKVFRVTQNEVEPVSHRDGQWIDTLAAGPGKAVAYASGRTVWVMNDGTETEFQHPRAVEGVAFAPKGLRIACARYNGVTLHWCVGKAAPVELEWNGAHTGVVWSADGKYIVSTMAENALHGWRLDQKATGEGRHMRMTGYPAKPTSLSWSAKGKWLASSGANAAICWPFSGKDGPMGKSPKELVTRGDCLVTCVACHPVEPVVAIGYSDGMIMLGTIEDEREVLLRRPGKGKISTLCWDAAGKRLMFGSEEGEAGLVDITG